MFFVSHETAVRKIRAAHFCKLKIQNSKTGAQNNFVVLPKAGVKNFRVVKPAFKNLQPNRRIEYRICVIG